MTAKQTEIMTKLENNVTSSKCEELTQALCNLSMFANTLEVLARTEGYNKANNLGEAHK